MATVFDLAAYILEKRGTMTAMHLHRLIYYAQAWSLVWDSKPIFDEEIQAWSNGPVCPRLYQSHRGEFEIGADSAWVGDPNALSPEQAESVDEVLKYYGDKTSHWLNALVHQEPPWINSRGSLGPGERGEAVISHAAMAEYYGSLV
jgi:uncharacterized phage-associated protein